MGRQSSKDNMEQRVKNLLEHKRAYANFSKHFEIDYDSGCWVWTGARRSAKGYGSFRCGKDSWLAHRASFAFKHKREGTRPLRHTCHNPRCVNPYHLKEGTHRDNGRDRSLRHISKEKRSEIKARHDAGESIYSIARALGYSETCISNVVRGSTDYQRRAWRTMEKINKAREALRVI